MFGYDVCQQSCLPPKASQSILLFHCSLCPIQLTPTFPLPSPNMLDLPDSAGIPVEEGRLQPSAGTPLLVLSQSTFAIVHPRGMCVSLTHPDRITLLTIFYSWRKL